MAIEVGRSYTPPEVVIPARVNDTPEVNDAKEKKIDSVGQPDWARVSVRPKLTTVFEARPLAPLEPVAPPPPEPAPFTASATEWQNWVNWDKAYKNYKAALKFAEENDLRGTF